MNQDADYYAVSAIFKKQWDVSGNRDNSACIDIDPDTLYALNAVKEKIA